MTVEPIIGNDSAFETFIQDCRKLVDVVVAKGLCANCMPSGPGAVLEAFEMLFCTVDS